MFQISLGQQVDIFFFSYDSKKDEWGWEYGIKAKSGLSQAPQHCDMIGIDVGMFAVLSWNTLKFYTFTDWRVKTRILFNEANSILFKQITQQKKPN